MASWSDNTDAGVKYFSGTASYTKTIPASADLFLKNEKLWLNPGDVKNLAEIFVNGKSLRIPGTKPFRVNITSTFKASDNKLK